MSSGAPRRAIWRCGLIGALAVVALAAGAARAAAAVSVFPIPGGRLATPQTQITFRGVPANRLGTISVSGSLSGAHSGKVQADSDGQGGSFLPDTPFVPGEVVTVRTSLSIIGVSNGTFSFTIQQPAGVIHAPPARARAPRRRGDVRSFRSRPDLHPAAVRTRMGGTGGGDIFLTPMRGPLQWGPMIVDSLGRLVWFQPVSGPKEEAADLRVQSYHGQPVLTWWQGYINHGSGKGQDFVYSQNYQQIAAVQAGNGLQADEHEFTITPQGTALITAFQLVGWDTSGIGGFNGAPVQDAVVQEIDIPTGLVLFQWDSLDHVPPAYSYSHATKRRRPLDYFHLNSIEPVDNGDLLISARNTWAMYKIDGRTGSVIWTLGGKHSSFKMGRGTQTAYQHDARLHPHGLLSVFDDGAAPNVHTQSRGLLERLNTARMTATLVRVLNHSPSVLARFEGSMQMLPHGKWFIGWGEQPYFSEYGPRGKQFFDGRFIGENTSYRGYLFHWHAQPSTPPALAASASGALVHLYASWNGATDVSLWRVLGGSSPSLLHPVATLRKRGFETATAVRSGDAYFAVQALSASHRVLATSSVVPR